MRSKRMRFTAALFGGVAAMAILASSAQAQAADIRVPEEPLAQSLRAVANQTGTNILFTPEAVEGIRAHAVQGNMSAREAVEQLLSGSNLEVVSDGDGGLIVRKKEAPRPQQHAELSVPETVVVTGSRIPGAEVASPVVTVTGDLIKKQGYTDLGDVVRGLPQSYNGGQNPGVVPGAPGVSNQNITSGSSVNLRGLGADATLTLLDGRRLASDGFTQAVDISVIPVAAVDRLEVLLDGASALYGSDAVGGVANIIIKRDYDGLSVTGRYGAATQGGDEQAEFSGVGGKTWDGGGFLVAYSGEWDSGIDSTQRDFTSFLAPQNTIYPSIMHQNVLVSGHQELAPNLELDLDAVYNFRNSHSDVSAFGVLTLMSSNSETWVVSPTLRMTLPHDWSLALNASAAQDTSHTAQSVFFLGTSFGTTTQCYCNTAQSVEFDAEGPVFTLPGGPAQVSLGAGYRNTGFKTGVSISVGGSRHAFYAFAETNFPFVSQDQNIPFVNRLVLNVAARFENYSDFGSVVTPKVGLIWAPTADFDLRGTWGQSFKAPTLLQEYEPSFVDVAPIALFGGSGPVGSTGLLLQGGSKNLKPERANTYTAGIVFHPEWIENLTIGFDYFNINYTNRVLAPIDNPGASFTNPAYADFINLAPSPALISSIVAGADSVLNQTGVTPLNLSSIIAIADDRYTNATRQHVSGVDLSFNYAIDISAGTLTTSGNVAWLQGNQETTPTSGTLQTVGTTYNPPKFRFRGGLGWTRDGLTLSAFANYIGGVKNTVMVPNVDGDGMATVDIVGDYKLGDWSPIENVELNLSIMNAFDQKPPFFNTGNPFIANYDSTNYSAIGRFVSFSITKSW